LLFPCRDTGFLEELIEAEEFTAEGAAVGGPLGFAGCRIPAVFRVRFFPDFIVITKTALGWSRFLPLWH